MSAAWPSAELDPVARLRVIAAGLPGAVLEERVIDAAFDDVWAVAGDLETGVPRFESGVRRLRILEEREGQLRVVARSGWGRDMHFDVELRPGWCLMRSRWIDIGMAAAPLAEGARTRFAHFEGGPGWLAPLLRRPLRRSVQGDLARLAGLFRAG